MYSKKLIKCDKFYSKLVFFHKNTSNLISIKSYILAINLIISEQASLYCI